MCTCFILLQALRKATVDKKLLRLCVVVFLSYLPEAGQYSCFFLYLRQVSSSIYGMQLAVIKVRIRNWLAIQEYWLRYTIIDSTKESVQYIFRILL